MPYNNVGACHICSTFSDFLPPSDEGYCRPLQLRTQQSIETMTKIIRERLKDGPSEVTSVFFALPCLPVVNGFCFLPCLLRQKSQPLVLEARVPGTTPFSSWGRLVMSKSRSLWRGVPLLESDSWMQRTQACAHSEALPSAQVPPYPPVCLNQALRVWC